MKKNRGYQPSEKSERETKACQTAYRKLTKKEQKRLSRTFRRFYRLQNFGESSCIELSGKLGMHLSEYLPEKLDHYANQLEIGDHKNQLKTQQRK